MFFKKFSSILIIFVLLFTLVANTVCCAEHVYGLGNLDIEANTSVCYPFKIKSVNTGKNKVMELIFSVIDPLGISIDYATIKDLDANKTIAANSAAGNNCRVKIKIPSSEAHKFSELSNYRFCVDNLKDHKLPFRGLLFSNSKLKLEKLDNPITKELETKNKDSYNAQTNEIIEKFSHNIEKFRHKIYNKFGWITKLDPFSVGFLGINLFYMGFCIYKIIHLKRLILR